MVGYPLDTVKVKIQTQDPSMGLKYKGTFDCLAQLIKQDGVSEFLIYVSSIYKLELARYNYLPIG